MEPVQPPGAAQPPPAGSDPPKPEGEAPKYVTEEQLQSALTERFRALEQKVDRTLSGLGPKLRDELATLFPKPEPKPPEGGDGKSPPRKAGDGEPAPELKKLQDQIAQLTTKAEAAERERDAERARARDTTLRQRLTEALSVAGIEGVRARHAVGLLVDAERRVRWTEDGQSIAFDDIELAAGLREWLKTDDAKLYLPARGALGSGDRPGAQPPPRAPAGPPDRTAVADGLRRVLLGQL
jgi:hypothetical protein